jgi:hypothetical protein
MASRDNDQTGRERRQYPRIDVANSAAIVVADGEQRMACLVTEWAVGGARLRPHDADSCPNLFTLITHDRREYRCQVVWRRDGEVGVMFPRADRIKI